MGRLFKRLGLTAALILAALVAYGFFGYIEARWEGQALRRHADSLIAAGLGAEDLGPGRAEMLLAIEDPDFVGHSGVDLYSPGGGKTTLTQSLAKRLAFDRFRPGIAKIRQTTYALGLEQALSKAQIFALWLDTVEMGEGPHGWMTGFFSASQAIYGRAPRLLSQDEVLRLVAVVIAPSRFSLTQADAELDKRVARIARLLAGTCAPLDNGDVWLEGCA